MFWFDWMTLAIVLGVTVIQTVRGIKAGGMGLPLFEAAGLVVSAVTATGVAGSVARALHLSKPVVLVSIFFLLAIGAFALGRWLYTVTQLSFESFDGVLSFIFGLVAGWTIGHVVLRVFIESQGPAGPIAGVMNSTLIAREVLQFRGWNWLVKLLFRARLAPEFNPDIG